MLEAAKLALRISTNAYDEEIRSLLSAAELDLKAAGVKIVGGALSDVADDLVMRALITYVRMNFGSPADYDRLRESYELQKCTLMHAGAYTEYEED